MGEHKHSEFKRITSQDPDGSYVSVKLSENTLKYRLIHPPLHSLHEIKAHKSVKHTVDPLHLQVPGSWIVGSQGWVDSGCSSQWLTWRLQWLLLGHGKQRSILLLTASQIFDDIMPTLARDDFVCVSFYPHYFGVCMCDI